MAARQTGHCYEESITGSCKRCSRNSHVVDSGGNQGAEIVYRKESGRIEGEREVFLFPSVYGTSSRSRDFSICLSRLNVRARERIHRFFCCRDLDWNKRGALPTLHANSFVIDSLNLTWISVKCMRASERLAGEVQSKKKKKRITNGSGLTQEIQPPSMECDRTRPETYQRLNINKRLEQESCSWHTTAQAM